MPGPLLLIGHALNALLWGAAALHLYAAAFVLSHLASPVDALLIGLVSMGYPLLGSRIVTLARNEEHHCSGAAQADPGHPIG